MISARDRVLEAIHMLECFYYLLQTLDDPHRTYLADLRRGAAILPKQYLKEVLTSLRKEIGQVRRETKCLRTDQELRALVTHMTGAGDGYMYLPKSYIDRRLFGNYARTFPRWPHIPVHALVIFDTKIASESPRGLFVAEAMLFDDVRLVWAEAKIILTDGKDFRSRDRSTHLRLHSLLRLAATATYRVLEAYLNGIAYSCFQAFHDRLTIPEHDLLAEWDSRRKRPRFVAFEDKLKKYPVLCAQYLQRTLAVEKEPCVYFLLKDGKILRDSLTHPSPYQNFETKDAGKIARIVQINPPQVKQLLECSIQYIRLVETGLGRDPAKSVPWLSTDFL